MGISSPQRPPRSLTDGAGRAAPRLHPAPRLGRILGGAPRGCSGRRGGAHWRRTRPARAITATLRRAPEITTIAVRLATRGAASGPPIGAPPRDNSDKKRSPQPKTVVKSYHLLQMLDA